MKSGNPQLPFKSRGSSSKNSIFGESAVSFRNKLKRKSVWVEELFLADEFSAERKDIPEKHLGQLITTSKWRLFIIFLIIVVALFLLRAWQLQINQGSTFRLLAEENRIRLAPILPQRGKIFDRNGVLLAENEPLYLLVINNIDWPETEVEQQKIFILLQSHNIAIDPEYIKDSLQKRQEIVLSELNYEQAMSLMVATQNIKGVNVKVMSRRLYFNPSVFSHLIGYLGPITAEQFASSGDDYMTNDYIGKVGLENVYEKELRGALGKKSIEVDAFGKEEKIISSRDAKDGSDLHLTIDSELQTALFNITSKYLKIFDLKRAAVIALNPTNGEILGLHSFPGYNNQKFYQGLDNEEYQEIISSQDKPLFNRTVSGQYPPASTFKTIVASAGLEDGLITPETTFLSEGGIELGKWFFPDWKVGGHGLTNLYKAIAESVNTYFFILGGGHEDFTGLGVSRINKQARKFGLGSLTGIDLPSEQTGFLPTPAWKAREKQERWYIGDTYNLSIGQGDILVTPLQMTMVMSTMANGGILWRPHIIQYLDNEEEHIINSGDWVRNTRVLDQKIFSSLQKALRETVLSGSAPSLQSVPAAVAGKTGTAEWRKDKKPHAWFIGYAPYDNPEVVLTILVEEGGEGSEIAVPIAEDFFTWYFTQYRD